MTERRPYFDAATAYYRGGWSNPLPVNGKVLLVSGYTGYDGRNVEWPRLNAWMTEYADRNIAVRLPGDVVGIDVDAYGDKVGAASMAAARAALGELPPSIRSTAREPFGESGITFYRVPGGASLRGAEKRFIAAFGGHVDIIRRDHRYAVVWPSVHPDTGGVYTWYGPDGSPLATPPRPADLAELPPTWVEFLSQPEAPAGVAPASPTDHERGAGTPTGLATVADDAGSPWDMPRVFSAAEAIEFVRPAFDRLRAAPDGTINNRLNEAAVTVGHFVPAFWSRHDVEAWLLDALRSTVYDGRTWRAEATIASALSARTWRAEKRSEPVAGELTAPTTGEGMADPVYQRGVFAGVRDRPRAEPRYGLRSDGRALLYPGKDSYLYAETESGKSWMVALTVSQCIAAGVPVLVVDYEESDEYEYGTRLLDLGVDERALDDPARFRYLMVHRRAGAEIMAEAADMGARLVIVEGMSVAYDLYGLAVNDNDSATAFRRNLVKPHLIAGRAVLATDHVTKDRESRSRYAMGAVMKLNAATGGAFLLVNVEGLAPGRRGASNLYSTKDRPGAVKRHSVAAGEAYGPQVRRVGTLVVDDSRAFVSYLDVGILAPAQLDAPAEVVTLSDRVLAAVRDIAATGQPANGRNLRASLGGRATDVDREIDRLVLRGLLTERTGPKNSRVFECVPLIENDIDH